VNPYLANGEPFGDGCPFFPSKPFWNHMHFVPFNEAITLAQSPYVGNALCAPRMIPHDRVHPAFQQKEELCESAKSAICQSDVVRLEMLPEPPKEFSLRDVESVFGQSEYSSCGKRKQRDDAHNGESAALLLT